VLGTAPWLSDSELPVPDSCVWPGCCDCREDLALAVDWAAAWDESDAALAAALTLSDAVLAAACPLSNAVLAAAYTFADAVLAAY